MWLFVVKSGKLFLLLNLKSGKAKMLNLIGVHECKMDAKGRVALPAALKKQLLPLLDQGFVLKRSVFQKCLELYPMQEWNREMAKVNQLNRFVKKNNDFIRLFTAGVKMLEIDNNTRLGVPRDLKAFAQLQSDIVLSASVGRIEMWDKKLYEETLTDTGENFGELAEQVMGSINEQGNELS